MKEARELVNEFLESGHGACPGCAMPVILRHVFHILGKDTVAAITAGCFGTISGIWPNSPIKLAAYNTPFASAAAAASGIRASLDMQGKTQTQVLAIAGDGGTFDIGIQALSGAAERNDDFIYVCYDNEAYMNTGVQRSSSTPVGAFTATSPAGTQSWGKERPKKNMPAIVLAHGIPYVATASIAYPKDLIRKVKQALAIQGPKYIEVHSPCPIGWGFDAAQTIELARLAVQTGLVPIYEAYQDQPLKVRKLSKRLPVVEYLQHQKRFRHLVDGQGDQAHLALIQSIADHNAEHYGL